MILELNQLEYGCSSESTISICLVVRLDELKLNIFIKKNKKINWLVNLSEWSRWQRPRKINLKIQPNQKRCVVQVSAYP